ncbi:MAG TPA: 50S ribosomal protein L25 [Peptococcaceae bacterium]|nr:50S ribosomal protein L25 [Peptococcaceae bacterium]
MARASLTLRVREEVGKGPAGRLRRRGLLPGVLYGREVGNLPVEVDLKEMKKVLGREGESALVQVKVEQGDQVREYTALVREVQRHPIRGELIHIDFFQVPAGEKITANVPVVLEGEPRGVKVGGILQHGLDEVEVECLPEDLPEAITVDVSGLDIGDSLKVADITPPPGVTLLSEPTSLIATVVTVRGAEAEEAAEETQEGAGEGVS